MGDRGPSVACLPQGALCQKCHLHPGRFHPANIPRTPSINDVRPHPCRTLSCHLGSSGFKLIRLSNSQELWMRNRDQAATDPVLLVVSVLDSLLSCSLPSMKVAPARTSGTSSWPLIRRHRLWAASSSL